MKTSSVRKRLVSPWIVGMPAFAFPFHIIKEAYTGRVLHFRNPRALLFKARGSLSRECYTSACRSPPSLSVQGKGCFRAGANSILTTRGSIYQLTPYQKDSELVDSQESVDADCKSLTRVLQSKRTVRTNRNGFTGFACLREFPKGTMRL